MIAQFIFGTLKANAIITNLVGARIYPLRGKQGAELPAIVWGVNNKEETTPSGMPKMSDYNIDISIYGDNYIEIDTIEAAISDALVNNPVQVDGHLVEAVFFEDSDDGIDPEINAIGRDLTYRILTHKQ